MFIAFAIAAKQAISNSQRRSAPRVGPRCNQRPPLFKLFVNSVDRGAARYTTPGLHRTLRATAERVDREWNFRGRWVWGMPVIPALGG